MKVWAIFMTMKLFDNVKLRIKLKRAEKKLQAKDALILNLEKQCDEYQERIVQLESEKLGENNEDFGLR